MSDRDWAIDHAGALLIVCCLLSIALFIIGFWCWWAFALMLLSELPLGLAGGLYWLKRLNLQ